jgi:hypothetical protein
MIGPMDRPTRHFVLGLTGAAPLRPALRMAGLKEKVFELDDDLSLGPIDPLDMDERIAFLQRIHGRPALGPLELNWNWLSETASRFWEAAADQSARRVVWYAADRASEFCAMAEWVRRFGSQPYEAVDLCSIIIPHPMREGPPKMGAAGSISAITAERIAEHRLWRFARPLTPQQRGGFTRVWRRLRSENADLRLVHGGRAASWPISVVDDIILSLADSEWRSSSRIVARTLGAFFDYGFIGALLPDGRISYLVDEGRLEMQPTDEEWNPLVRRPPAPPSA